LATTGELLRRGWNVVGISRSASPIEDDSYHHFTVSVADDRYPDTLRRARDELAELDLCIYFAGIGELLDPTSMKHEVEVFAVNLLGMVMTATYVVPSMVARHQGHFMGLSSVADGMLSGEAPSYHASKAGFTNYMEGLALALKPTGVKVTNIRFGFVDTKMAKGSVKPFMMPVERAVNHVMKCIAKKPVRHTAPRMVTPLVKFRAAMLRLKAR
jgi:NAD(P)-dependent dehydrogenase (short-subunit alcohol dehydrogenase family)